MASPPDLLSTTASNPTTSVTTEGTAATDLTFDSTNALRTVQEAADPSIFVAAQRGDVQLLKELIESGQAQATDRDDQNITALHWAAINAQLAACRYLLEQGAEVDALGGDLVATPLQWAARNGYIYIIQLLIAHNADPTITDNQGYNTLHLVTHSSSVMPLLYLLQQPISVDSRDAQKHTSLMWAAYQGDAISVDLLLRHGAEPNTKDESDLTPLHWAVVKGNRNCIRKLVEKGADLTAKNQEGKTAKDMASELKSLGAYKRALEELGMNEDGLRKTQYLSERNTKITIFMIPTVFFFLMFSTLSMLPWYTGIILAMAEFFGMHHIVTRVLLERTSYIDGTRNVTHSPYYAGIIFASLVWVAYCWVTRLVQHTQHHGLSHLIFALSFGLCTYNFVRAITLDAGSCPKPANDGELKSIIEDLASEGRLNGQTFCIQCMARKPLRSKHCRTCDRCIARHDHHCPWIWNCVGVNNHRQFLIFLITLVIGIIAFDSLTYAYFSVLKVSDTTPYCPLPDDLCALTAADPFVVSVAVWSTLQLVWTVVLLASQLWQVSRQVTTFEVSNLGRYGYMGGRVGAGMLNSQMGHQHHHQRATTMDSDTESSTSNSGGGATHAHRHSHSVCGRVGGCTGFLLQLTGMDLFTKGRGADGLARARKAPNPFSLGFVGNCTDFWTKGRELGVEYERLYDVPMEGFREAKAMRLAEEEADRNEHPADNVERRKVKGLLMGWIGRRRSREGYEPVSQV